VSACRGVSKLDGLDRGGRGMYEWFWWDCNLSMLEGVLVCCMGGTVSECVMMCRSGVRGTVSERVQ
jgi:hypothetical protein